MTLAPDAAAFLCVAGEFDGMHAWAATRRAARQRIFVCNQAAAC
jgi:hypothetical protein